MNIKRAMKCREKFHEGQQERLNHPLPYGAYKMKEVGNRLESCLESLLEIINYKLSGQPMPTCFRHCANSEVNSWLKDRPLDIAKSMGYDILPGIAALGGDGVTKGDVQRIKARYKTVISAIIVQCDAVHRRGKNYNLTFALLCLAVETIDAILCDAGHPRK